jgi:hypothetical protein
MIPQITIQRRKSSVQRRRSASPTSQQTCGTLFAQSCTLSMIANIKSTIVLSIILMYGSIISEQQNQHVDGIYLPVLVVSNCLLQSTFAYTMQFPYDRFVQRHSISSSIQDPSVDSLRRVSNIRQLQQQSFPYVKNAAYSNGPFHSQVWNRILTTTPATTLHATTSSSSSSTIGSSPADENEDDENNSNVSNTNHTVTDNNTSSKSTTPTTSTTATPGNSTMSSGNNTASDSKDSSSSSPSSTSNHQDETNKNDNNNIKKDQIESEAKKMKVGELKQILESQGISTRTFIEKSEFIKAYVQWKNNGGESTSSSTGSSSSSTSTSTTRTSGTSSGTRKQQQQQQNKNDPQYRDVVLYKMNRNDPNMLQGTFIDVTIKSE